MYKFGILGVGKMGSSILNGILEAKNALEKTKAEKGDKVVEQGMRGCRSV